VLAHGVDAELDRYIQEAADVNCDCGLSWLERESSYPLLAPVTEDLVSSVFTSLCACFFSVWRYVHSET